MTDTTDTAPRAMAMAMSTPRRTSAAKKPAATSARGRVTE